MILVILEKVDVLKAIAVVRHLIRLSYQHRKQMSPTIIKIYLYCQIGFTQIVQVASAMGIVFVKQTVVCVYSHVKNSRKVHTAIDAYLVTSATQLTVDHAGHVDATDTLSLVTERLANVTARPKVLSVTIAIDVMIKIIT